MPTVLRIALWSWMALIRVWVRAAPRPCVSSSARSTHKDLATPSGASAKARSTISSSASALPRRAEPEAVIERDRRASRSRHSASCGGGAANSSSSSSADFAASASRASSSSRSGASAGLSAAAGRTAATLAR